MCSARVCLTTAYMNTLEPMAQTEKQHEKVQVCERKNHNNAVSIIVGVKRADKRKIYDMKVDVGIKESSKKKLARSIWCGHVEKMGDE